MAMTSPSPAARPSPFALTTRVLPPSEWPRLAGFEPFASAGLPDDPDNWAVVVVERDGQIVGSCSLFTAMHWDAWWIDPAQPGLSRGTILRQLVATSLQLFVQLGTEKVFTGAEEPAVARMLTHFGFAPAGQLFMLRIADVDEAFWRAREEET